MGPSQGDVTLLLNQVADGDPEAEAKLVPLIYDELRRLAAYRLAHEQPGQTLQATALVHEAYLRLVQANCAQWENPRHFFNAVAETMRRILIDSARRKQSQKHGGSLQRLSLEDNDLPASAPPEEILAVDEALERLAQAHPEEAEVVKLRYFVGLKHQEIADALGVSEPTIRRHWAVARVRLFELIAQRPFPPLATLSKS